MIPPPTVHYVCVYLFECVKEIKVYLILRSILKVSRALRMGGAGAGGDGAMPLLNCVQGAAMSLCEQGAREATAPGPHGPAGPPCDVSEHPQGPVDPNCGGGGGGDVGGGGDSGGGGGGAFGGAGGL